ncbi:hypothetical protein [Metabacillus arenae]|uniref:Uncharacterized protein n=1 Tax=Metabacillus arenae TaxID=2771434 RepID=A0A926NGA1_9BACI|nr:hypothetical protein [Metabacillus arenae]MBD1382904.1 hypothetical protein [Metabacillus arenae]
MGMALMCTVTVNGTVSGVPIVDLQVSVPTSRTGLISPTIPLGGVLGDVVLVNIPCPTVEDIQVQIGTLASLTVRVTETMR